jgi:hypothetical protein
VPDSRVVAARLVFNDAEIVIGVGMFAIGFDGAFKTLLAFLVALHHEFADADFVVHRGAARLAFQGCLVEVDRVEEVLIRAQFVAAFFEVFGRCPGSWRIGAVHGRRADLQLFGALSLQRERWKNQKRTEEKRRTAEADPGKHIPPLPEPTKVQSFRPFQRTLPNPQQV